MELRAPKNGLQVNRDHVPRFPLPGRDLEVVRETSRQRCPKGTLKSQASAVVQFQTVGSYGKGGTKFRNDQVHKLPAA